MARRTTRAVKNAGGKYDSVASAARSGDTRAALTALRDVLATGIDDCASKRDLAALSRQFTAVMALIDALPPLTQPLTIAEELAERRAARRAAADSAGSGADSSEARR